jgi:hypothetical protein
VQFLQSDAVALADAERVGVTIAARGVWRHSMAETYTGRSASLSFEEALRDAITQLPDDGNDGRRFDVSIRYEDGGVVGPSLYVELS